MRLGAETIGVLHLRTKRFNRCSALASADRVWRTSHHEGPTRSDTLSPPHPLRFLNFSLQRTRVSLSPCQKESMSFSNSAYQRLSEGPPPSASACTAAARFSPS